MTTVNQDFSLWQCDDKTLSVSLTESGAALNITGCTIRWVLRKEAASGTALLTKTTASGITITNGVAGLCSIALADTDTDDIDPGVYYHEMSVVDTLGNVSTVLTGRCTVYPSAVAEA